MSSSTLELSQTVDLKTLIQSQTSPPSLPLSFSPSLPLCLSLCLFVRQVAKCYERGSRGRKNGMATAVQVSVVHYCMVFVVVSRCQSFGALPTSHPHSIMILTISPPYVSRRDGYGTTHPPPEMLQSLLDDVRAAALRIGHDRIYAGVTCIAR